ncbi:ABC transporter ATP-binding protein [Streptomyces nodosus]|uniref:ATP-binding cassette domain-containing protein n=1 Tax=Streptomyces nodosus TaxID=40318 RepID=A0A5P2W6U3_9ACTN|nr:ABC transporter ATP-binding protein [Streptomyces nodosus]MBB4793923.1 ATP-binding cassette subfamily B protein [Streptomyces nodosus]QEV41105.1 ATP-binding cassette domain-containing protein [Streptomyces nodosus]
MPTPHASESRSTVRVLLRLWPYVRPVRARLLTAALVATVASCVSLVIPLVLKWLVDGPVTGGDPAGVWLGALYLLLLGIAEAGLFGIRRWLVARPLSRVEADLRADLYRHLQRLPVAFHDRWASGQLLSRATTDLMLLRQFLAFPLTFLLVNGVTILVGVVIMLLQDWRLGLIVLGPGIPVMILCALFERRYARVARRAQDQVGDLTTVVEESVLGIRIVKGFGRHRSQARAFGELSRTLRGTELVKARLLAQIWAVIVTLPEVAIGAALVLGIVRVADGALSAGTLVAFLSTALALRWPVDSIGFLLAMSQEAATATERYFEVMDEEPESTGVSGTGKPRTAGAGAARPGETGSGIAGEGVRGSAAGAIGNGTHSSTPAGTPEGGKRDPVPASTTEDGRYRSTPAGTAENGEHDSVPAGTTKDGAHRSTPTGTPEGGERALVPAGAAGDGGRGCDPVDGGVPAGDVGSQERGSVSVGGGTGGLRFHGVCFRYPDAPSGSPPVLDRVDLQVRPGETMALVGATGSGKTTLTALIPRLHEVTSGRITLDGEDITAMPREELRSRVAVAFEEPTLFSASVGDNVLMGAPDTAGDRELERALGIAQADFAHALPQGTRTQVGEQGLSLSGGQRQRLALARAVVGSPRFLVLDDPLSALDVHTEAAVEAALRRVLDGTTALVVAHRPSTVLLADRVALLSGGRIAAVGTHQELLRTHAEYAHLMSGNPGNPGNSEEVG